jgi:hypothetical protein
MQAGRTEAAVEFGRVEFDVLEILRERLLADELIDGVDRLARLRGECLIGDEQQPVGVLAAPGLM